MRYRYDVPTEFPDAGQARTTTSVVAFPMQYSIAPDDPGNTSDPFGFQPEEVRQSAWSEFISLLRPYASTLGWMGALWLVCIAIGWAAAVLVISLTGVR